MIDEYSPEAEERDHAMSELEGLGLIRKVTNGNPLDSEVTLHSNDDGDLIFDGEAACGMRFTNIAKVVAPLSPNPLIFIRGGLGLNATKKVIALLETYRTDCSRNAAPDLEMDC